MWNLVTIIVLSMLINVSFSKEDWSCVLDWNEHVDPPVTSVTQHVRAQKHTTTCTAKDYITKNFQFCRSVMAAFLSKTYFLDPRYIIIVIYLIQTANKMMAVVLMMIFNEINL